MKIEVCLFTLNGNRAAVRDYANTIASISASNCNAYVMAFDKNNEILWTVQAGDDIDEVKAAINWQGVRRVEIYDHSVDGAYKTEQVYITSRKSLNEYTAERSAFDFFVVNNYTQYTADNWQTEDSDNAEHVAPVEDATEGSDNAEHVAPVEDATEGSDNADTLDIAPAAPADSIQATEGSDNADTLDVAPSAPADSIQATEGDDNAEHVAPVAHDNIEPAQGATPAVPLVLIL